MSVITEDPDVQSRVRKCLELKRRAEQDDPEGFRHEAYLRQYRESMVRLTMAGDKRDIEIFLDSVVGRNSLSQLEVLVYHELREVAKRALVKADDGFRERKECQSFTDPDAWLINGLTRGIKYNLDVAEAALMLLGGNQKHIHAQDIIKRVRERPYLRTTKNRRRLRKARDLINSA